MSEADDGLRRLAERWGIDVRHQDAFGQMIDVSAGTLRHILATLGCPAATPAAVQQGLRAPSPNIAHEKKRHRSHRSRCVTMADLGHDRLWGLSVQLYGLRSGRNWGIGDFTDLGDLAEIMASTGAAAIGINPLHALFPAEPGHCSPYSPSSREFLNPLYIDLEAAPEWRAVRSPGRRPATFARDLATVRAAELIDYRLVASLKRQALEALFQRFRDHELAHGTARAKAFLDFVERGGPDLARFACFEALHEHALANDFGWSWQDWPDGLDDPESDGVRRFADAHADRIRFSQFQQWLADEQLGRAQARAKAAGMPIGLYRDLAVAVDPTGAAAWSRQQAIASGVAVGAPPDPFNALGQNWGLAPFSPAGLLADDLEPLAADLGANMRHAGALRIDHVMGLRRLFWIPAGAAPEAGAYVSYPLERMLDVVARESQAQSCIVIGEDLGTVPPGFRRKVAAAGLLSYRLFYFERSRSGGPKPPARYPKEALVSISTHDLPTLQGFWHGRDLAWRERLGLHPSPAAKQAAEQERTRDLDKMASAFSRAGFPLASDDDVRSLTLAAHSYLAATPSRLMMVQIEDLLGEIEQANLPGTVGEHPNWRRRLPIPIEALADQPLFGEIADIMKQAGRSIDG